MIELKNVSYSYSAGNKRTSAISDISVSIRHGAVTAIIGKTGSGKSTLAELIAGIIKPDKGTINGIAEKKMGIVFQYPEYQLFEETVYKDIAFGSCFLPSIPS